MAERYHGAEVDTVLTIEIYTMRPVTDQERMMIMKRCELRLLDRLDSILIVQTSSAAIPCLSSIPYFTTLGLRPPYSPDL